MAFNTEEISTQLMFSTIQIIIQTKDGIKSGTGHIYIKRTGKGEVPMVITNYHVVEGCVAGEMHFTESKDGKPIVGSRLVVKFDANYILQHYSQEYDIAIIPFGPILNNFQNQGKSIFFRSISDDIFINEDSCQELSAIEEITFIGYPRGLSDQKNNLPIIRRGITSTPIWNHFNGKNIFLIDASSFPGSSGSPVFIFNQGMYAKGTSLIAGMRILYCGILTETIKHKSQDGDEYLNLGAVVNAMQVTITINDFMRKIENLA
jgi:hypothetical protein